MSETDRISELYFREVFDWDMQEKARDRIHWMCERVSDGPVLDLGCSQGIVSILLGREGFEVTGVDLNPEAIAFAADRLAEEPELVNQRVSFQVADAVALPFADSTFGATIAGEVLEHLTHPERVLKEVQRVLVPGGRAVITVPFGVHPHPDHKQTFYLVPFLDLVSGLFAVQDLILKDKYIHVVAERVAEGACGHKFDSFDLHMMTEKAMEEIEQKLHASIDRSGRQLRGLRRKTDESQEQTDRFREDLFEMGRERERVALELREKEVARQRLSTELTGLRERVKGLEIERSTLEDELEREREGLSLCQQSLLRTQSEERTLEEDLNEVTASAKSDTAANAVLVTQIDSARRDIDKLTQERKKVSGLLDRAGVARGEISHRLESFVKRFIINLLAEKFGFKIPDFFG